MRQYTGWYRIDVHRAKYRMRVNAAARAQSQPSKPRSPQQVKDAVVVWTYIVCIAVFTLLGGAIGGDGSALSLVGFLLGIFVASVITAVLKGYGAAPTKKVDAPPPPPSRNSANYPRKPANNLTESEKGFTVPKDDI
jgi:hypothetical protein